MAHVHMSPAQHTFSGQCLTAPSPAAIPTSQSVAPQDSAQRCMAMLSLELSSIKDRDVPSQVEAGAAAAQSTMPYATPSQSTLVNIMVSRTIRAALAEMKANSEISNT
ncbi:hypothetical protein LIA77_01711 [Sarocladium implicatum]|nr:hypothetical protein LIA77_01711 [Sarocladium implicatum]